MRDALRYWIKNGTKGNIVNIASESAISGHQNFLLYCGLKAAILRSSSNVALDAAPYDIRVNCILPGITDTIPREYALEEGIPLKVVEERENYVKQVPLCRQGSIREIGNTVVWLSSEEAAYITGANIPVDGGLTLPGLMNMNVEDDEEAYGLCTRRNLSNEDLKDG